MRAPLRRAGLVVVGAVALWACVPPPAVKPDPPRTHTEPEGDEAGARAAAVRFLDAAERGEFAAVWGLLSSSWRGRYTPERLAADFSREPLAKERLARARAALAGPLQVKGDAATLALGGDRRFRLVKEQGRWLVAALE